MERTETRFLENSMRFRGRLWHRSAVREASNGRSGLATTGRLVRPEGGGADRVRSGLFLIVTLVNGLQACRLDPGHGESLCRIIVVKRKLSTIGLLARASIKNAANCDT